MVLTRSRGPPPSGKANGALLQPQGALPQPLRGRAQSCETWSSFTRGRQQEAVGGVTSPSRWRSHLICCASGPPPPSAVLFIFHIIRNCSATLGRTGLVLSKTLNLEGCLKGKRMQTRGAPDSRAPRGVQEACAAVKELPQPFGSQPAGHAVRGFQ